MTEAEIKQILDAAYKLSDWVNFYWNFYIVFLAGTLSWVFNAKEPWLRSQKIVVTLLFTGFVLVSLIALSSTYLALGPTVEALRIHWQTDSEFKQALVSLLQYRFWRVQLMMHFLADLLVVYCIWTKTPKKTR